MEKLIEINPVASDREIKTNRRICVIDDNSIHSPLDTRGSDTIVVRLARDYLSPKYIERSGDTTSTDFPIVVEFVDDG